jgi:hypothetical protein
MAKTAAGSIRVLRARIHVGADFARQRQRFLPLSPRWTVFGRIVSLESFNDSR